MSVGSCCVARRSGAGWPGHGATPTAESTAKRRRIVTRRSGLKPRSASSRGSMSSLGMVVGALVERLAADDAQARAVGPARAGAIGSASWIASRTGVSRSSSWWSVSRGDIRLVVGRQRPAGREVERRQELLLDLDLDRDRRRRAGSGCTRARARRAGPRVGEDPAVRPGQPDAALDRLGEAQVLAEVDRDAGDLVVAVGAGLRRRAARRRSRRAARRRGRAVTGRLACDGSSASSSQASSSGSPSSGRARRRRASARRSSSIAIPFLMLWSVLTTSPSSPTRTLDGVLVGAAADLVGIVVGVGDDLRGSAPRRPGSGPRSSMRKAACSWALATIRSASSWAFSMIRSPSELIRLAARTSSGTATRSSSMRPSAAFWSTTTLVVSGSFLPLAMSDSRRSTRKMMSIGVPSWARSVRDPARDRHRVWHAGRGVSGLGSASREGRGGRRRDHRGHVAAERGDLLDQARADVAVLDRGHEEDRVDVAARAPGCCGRAASRSRSR